MGSMKGLALVGDILVLDNQVVAVHATGDLLAVSAVANFLMAVFSVKNVIMSRNYDR